MDRAREWPAFSGEWLREQRCVRGLTQAQVAELIGVSHISVSNWENDRCQPKATNLWDLLRVFDGMEEVLW